MKQGFSALTIENAEDGVNKCLHTSHRLLKSAELLYNAKFQEVASFLVCAAIDEIGKAFLLLDFQDDAFAGRKDSREALSDSFYEHRDKFESALGAVRDIEARIQAVSKLEIADDSAQGIARAIRQLIDQLESPDARADAERTFQMRNEFLYTNYHGGEFVSPNSQPSLTGYHALRECAEKAADLVQLRSVLDKMFRARGASREMATKIFLENLPEMLEELHRRTSERKK